MVMMPLNYFMMESQLTFMETLMLMELINHGIMQMDGHTEKMMPHQLHHLMRVDGILVVKMLVTTLVKMNYLISRSL